MAKRRTAQLNIRSEFARERVREIAARTGMTATEIVEEALRGYMPLPDPPPDSGLIRKGRILVLARRPDEDVITHEEAEAMLEASRVRDL
jgi:hypothetical protein